MADFPPEFWTAITALSAVFTAGLAFLSRKVEKVHKLVNANSTEQDRRNDQLVQALQAAGVVVPPARPRLNHKPGG